VFVVGAIAVLLSGMSALNARPVLPQSAAMARLSDVLEIERASGGKLLAIGRLDNLSAVEFRASVLGQNFELIATAANLRFVDQARIGSPVALFGEVIDGKFVVDSALQLDGQYVQGASKVYLRGEIGSLNRRTGVASIGAAQFDASSVLYSKNGAGLRNGSATALLGTQPAIGGVILVERVLRTRPDASVGTGRPDASVGTGRPEASVGTGRPDASVGTGSTEASVRTGRPEASVGTGRPDASVGTGRPDASVGTGSPDASVGTGSPEASVGTGRPEASVGTGRPDASVGTGNSAG
jgi:hypothetical protein